MIIVSNLSKSIGPKQLFQNITFQINKSEKVAIIGRNGVGKTTLFRALNGEVSEFGGFIEIANGVSIIRTEQEHFIKDTVIVLDYILDIVPNYRKLSQNIYDYEKNPSSDINEIELYTNALADFHSLEYSTIENRIINSLEKFGIVIDNALSSINNLSGGEKRYVELLRVQYSKADIALLDEPTNHMDYIGKANFISWLKDFNKTVILITHDRDVLNMVDKIIEIKTDSANVINGNYTKYIVQNSGDTLSDINAYKLKLKEVEEKRVFVENLKILKSKTKGVHAIMKLAKKIERYTLLYQKAKSELIKPSFWIDQESLLLQDQKNIDNYNSFRAKSINFQSILLKPVESEKYINEMVTFENLSIGYTPDDLLIENLSLKLKYGMNLELRGRNGSGKSTLIKAIISTYYNNGVNPATVRTGQINLNPKIRLGIYEQEINDKYLEYTLAEILFSFYSDLGKEFNEQELSRVLSNYLFDPKIDKDLKFKDCSGGQKARIQIIKMLLNNPNLIILDEPTNHLDLPSIEELENMLKAFNGSIIFVSHDHYFRKNIAENVITYIFPNSS